MKDEVIAAESYREALHASMHEAMARNSQTIIMGQGVDDHKGIFGSTSGLVDEFGEDRVFDTPLAEEGMMGVAIGAALNGLYPIQTHIRADFGIVAMNQIVNLAAKYKYMFGGRFEVPMLIRMVIGRSWGQGAQHSQSLQSLFAHIPGLKVVMPSHPRAIRECYRYAVQEYRSPVISFEHRLMYDLRFEEEEDLAPEDDSPFTSYMIRRGEDVTIVATSIMVLEAQRAAKHLATEGNVDCEVIDLNCISDPSVQMILESVRKTGKLVVADTSWKAYGVCSEICRLICEDGPTMLTAPVVSLGMQPSPCPTAKALEDLYYPNLGTMVDEIATLATGTRKHGVSIPAETSMADVYKRFKGPF